MARPRAPRFEDMKALREAVTLRCRAEFLDFSGREWSEEDAIFGRIVGEKKYEALQTRRRRIAQNLISAITEAHAYISKEDDTTEYLKQADSETMLLTKWIESHLPAQAEIEVLQKSPVTALPPIIPTEKRQRARARLVSRLLLTGRAVALLFRVLAEEGEDTSAFRPFIYFADGRATERRLAVVSLLVGNFPSRATIDNTVSQVIEKEAAAMRALGLIPK